METQGNISKSWRLRKGTYTNLDDLIFKWLLIVWGSNRVNYENSQKVKKLAVNINIKGFWAPDGWLVCQKNRCNVVFKTGFWRRQLKHSWNDRTMKEHNYPYDFVQVQIYESDDVDRFGLFWLVCNLTSKKILLGRRYDEPLSIYSRLAAMTI